MSTSVLLFFIGLVLIRDALGQTCGLPSMAGSFTTRIMNGLQVKQGDFPWMAAVMTKPGGIEKFTCTGFLIDSRHVLTAAHCFSRMETEFYTTRIGDIYYANGTRYDVVKIVVHEGYNSDFFYDDIAMLTLDREVRFPGFYPICLPFEESSRRNLETRQTTVAGWGAEKPESEGGTSSPVLMRLSSMPVISNRECNKIYKGVGFRTNLPRGITPGLLCAGFIEGGRDSCNGDSGGPLMIRDNGRWVVVAIVAFGYQCGVQGFVAGYTRVSFYMNWIRSKMRA